MTEPTEVPMTPSTADSMGATVDRIKAESRGRRTSDQQDAKNRDLLWRIVIVVGVLVVIDLILSIAGPLYDGALVDRNHRTGQQISAQICQFYDAVGVKEPASCASVKRYEDPTLSFGNDAAAQRSEKTNQLICQFIINVKNTNPADVHLPVPAVCGGQ